MAPGPYQAGPDERATTKSVPSPREGCAFPEISHPRVPRQANTKSSRPPSAPTTISKPHRRATPKAPWTASLDGFSSRCCRFGTKIGSLLNAGRIEPLDLPTLHRRNFPANRRLRSPRTDSFRPRSRRPLLNRNRSVRCPVIGREAVRLFAHPCRPDVRQNSSGLQLSRARQDFWKCPQAPSLSASRHA